MSFEDFFVGYKSRVVGIIRFSHIQKNNQAFDLEERAEKLFDETRLEKRSEYFEKFTLPSLDSQEDKDFSILVRSSSLMPDVYKKRLTDIAKSRDYISLAFLSPEVDAKKYEKEVLDVELLDSEPGPVITFRLDDDDALSFDYISAVKKYMCNDLRGFAISFPQGFYSLEKKNGEIEYYRTNRKMLAVGLAYVSPRRNLKKYIFNLGVGHLRTDHKVPVVIDSRSPSFIVSAHEYNDSSRRDDKKFFLKKFKTSAEAVAENFPWLLG